MRHFSHLKYRDRLKIADMQKEKHSVKEIADALHVTPATIYRELKRGAYMHMKTDLTLEKRYSPEIAQNEYEANLKAKGPNLKIGNDHQFAAYIEHKIADESYSPAAILGEIQEQGLTFDTTICIHTLYSYIDKGVFLSITNKDLPQHGKRKKPRKYNKVRPARLPRGESIEDRPDEINNRKSFGHWEMDTVYGKKRTKRVLLVFTERFTRKEIIMLVKDRTAASTVKALNQLERRYGKRFTQIFKSITVDNGVEFSDCAGMEKSIYGDKRTTIYYCHPYSSWERGSNENQNGLIRRPFPKGTNFDRVTHKKVAAVEKWLNHYPREMFGWRCSESLFSEQLINLGK